MKIIKDTIVFKSFKCNFDPEVRGFRRCTVREFTRSEERKLHPEKLNKIRIEERIVGGMSGRKFTRRITNISEHDFNGVKMFLFCWHHPRLK